ncbi:HlyD family efflux transporter periplasmic adaptor subunit [Nodosilinea sp. LEGE 07298]|uniref:efflux RND transporter periplasmic adaptor subunit n=1 Tax=Nodosilinea sp. LEGE 07298 TaxID=2777970 RepID=UPI001881D82B|nr:HlyD family efflux transporter periplasmic adaptor subunit [Nodosilinea sp. LEGE 07298]MBE9110426.1 HlyD family efflux transporter periplasmic adaptor subunit [Nodosilinea sp. LEGE 07298]
MTSTESTSDQRTLGNGATPVPPPKRRWRRRWLYGIGGLGLAGLIAYAVRPQPIAVDLAPVERGALQVTVGAEGQTRVRDRYVVASPIDGELQRIDLNAGDTVTAGATIARLDPLPLTSQVEATQARRRAVQAQIAGVDTQRPKPEALAQAETRIRAAQAQVTQAQAQVTEAEATLVQAQRDRDRMASLQAQGAVPRQDLETMELAVTQRQQALETARQQVSVAQADVQAAQANLAVLTAEQQDPDYLVDVYQAELAALDAELASLTDDARRTTITAPAAGRVLEVLEPSARFVAAGTPLITLGDPNGLELVIDILSTDAVRVSPGDAVQIDRWGGEKNLQAIVRQVEPSAFTEVSALGVDEQRVNVIADFTDPAVPLGDGFRVDAQIVVWEEENVLTVPISALFRCDTDWCAFVAEDGRAQRREVAIGPRSDFAAVVESGLAEGDQVILYPGDQIEADVRVRGR